VKPILFASDMVRAILDGRKTATRRIVKAPVLYRPPVEPPSHIFLDGDLFQFQWNTGKTVAGFAIKPPYLPGDILYVREAFACDGFDGEKDVYVYRADVDECGRVVWGDIEKNEWAPKSDYNWHPSIHMPKEAARIFLRVTDVRVERLQEIGNCIKEGIPPGTHATAHMNEIDERSAFASLWNGTIKPEKLSTYGWDANPYVWVIEFERIDKVEGGHADKP